MRVEWIGKEPRNLESAGITEDPTHTIYNDPDLDAWTQAYLPTLRRLRDSLRDRLRSRAETVRKRSDRVDVLVRPICSFDGPAELCRGVRACQRL
jgi:hypothetical protein